MKASLRRSGRRRPYVPRDTTLEAYRAQIEAYRRMGGAGRAAVMSRLNAFARQNSMAGIRARHPGYDEERVRLAYLRLVLGDELVRRMCPGCELVEP